MIRKETWKTIIQIVISVLTAIATSMGVSSCRGVKHTICRPKVKACKTRVCKPPLNPKRLIFVRIRK